MLISRKLSFRLVAFLAAAMFFALPAQAQTKIKGIFNAGHISILPLVIAQDQGFLAKRGIELDLRYVQAGSQPIASLLSGDVQLFIGTGDGVTARLAGADVVYIMGFVKVASWGLWTANDSPIKTIQDLKGRRLGTVGGLGGSARLMIEYLLLRNGMKLEDVRVTQMATATTTLAALKTGAIEVGTLLPPESIWAQNDGMRLIARGRDQGWEAVSTSMMVMGDYLKKNRETIKGLIEAEMEGAMVTQKDPALAKKILKAAYKSDDDKFIDELFDAFQNEYLLVPQPASASAYKGLLTQVTGTFPHAATVNPEEFVDRTPIEEIVKSGFADKLK